MSTQPTVLNYFEQAVAGDNALVLGGTVKGADGTQPAAITNISNTATGTEIATAVNGILAALRNAGIIAT